MQRKMGGPSSACGKPDLYEEWLKNENNKKEASEATTSNQTDGGLEPRCKTFYSQLLGYQYPRWLRAINQRLKEEGIAFHLSEVKGPIMDGLKKTNFYQ